MIPTHRPPTHPGEMLAEEFLEPLGLSLPQFDGLVRQTEGVTPETAQALARLLGTSAEFWLSLQRVWDEYHALHGGTAA